MRAPEWTSRVCAVVVAALAFGACARFDPPERTASELPLADSFSLYEPTAPVPGRWWESYESDELDTLISQAIEGNLTLQQVYARLLQSGSLAKQAGAVRWPDLNATGDASVTRRHTDNGQSPDAVDKLAEVNSKLRQVDQLLSTIGDLASGTIPSGGSSSSGGGTGEVANERTFNSESYRFGIASSYELDLWGRLRARHEAALLDLGAAQEDLYTSMLSISSEVTLRYLDMVAVKQAVSLIKGQLESNRKTLELVEFRVPKGLASALDVFQQRQVIAQTEAVIPSLESRLETLQHELAVLLGKPPKTSLGLEACELPALRALPELGVPSDLLSTRPDVRAAGLRLQAADWRVSAARADRLPAIKLTGSASYGSEEWDLVFDNWMATLGSSLTGPIFDAGRRKAEVERTRAVVDERLAAYKQTVLVAMKEVEDALVGEAKQAEYVAALETQLAAARATHGEAFVRYLNGMNDYLPVLSALVSVQSLERNMVQAKRDLLGYRVQLHRALGGAWMRDTLTQ